MIKFLISFLIVIAEHGLHNAPLSEILVSETHCDLCVLRNDNFLTCPLHFDVVGANEYGSLLYLPKQHPIFVLPRQC